MSALSQTHNYLIQHSIKPSVQRAAIMAYLMANKTHPTVDEIYSALSPEMPTLSKTTVYNTLALFAERGAIRILTLDEKNARYDIDISAHAHLICRKCGKVYDLMDLKQEAFQIPVKQGFEIESVEISYNGVCAGCKSGN